MDYPLADFPIDYQVLLVVLFFLITIPVALLQLFGPIGVEIASVIFSGGLTFALVILYYQQTELMKQEFESNPRIEFPLGVEKDEIIFQLLNSGAGTIQYMNLKSEIVSDTGSIEIYPARSQLISTEADNNTLQSYSGPKKFRGEVKFRKGSEDSKPLPFRYIVDDLVQEGIERCELKLSLEVEDEVTQNGDELITRKIPIQEIDLSGKNAGKNVEEKERSRLYGSVPMYLSDVLVIKSISVILPTDSPFYDDE